MKIAMIEEDLSVRSGSRRFICKISQKLQELGHTVKIFGTKLDTKTCFPEFLSLPVEIIPVHEFKSQAISIINRALRRNVDYHWTKTMAILEISRRIAEWGADAAIFNYCGEHWLYPFFYYLKDPIGAVILHVTPPVSGAHSLPFQSPTRLRRIEDKLLKLTIKKWRDASFHNLGLIITHSRYLFAQALRQGVIGTQKSAIVPLGVDQTEFFPTGEEESFALYAGRIRPYKSLELAVLAMKDTPPDMSLILTGDLEYRDLSYKERLESIAEGIGILDRFKIISSPTNDQLVRLMQKCSVFLFPSTIDTFGLVVLEAMACGKPIIACRRGGVPELVENAGLLLEPNVTQWQDAVKKVLSDANLRQEMGRQAFERSMLYSWKKTAHSLIEALEKLPS